MAAEKVPVSMRALVQRLNRKLPAGQQLRAAKGALAREQFGDFYVVGPNGVVRRDVKPHKLAAELGALETWEELAP